MNLSIEERIDLTKHVVKDIQVAQEIILIRDEGCIINYTCEIQPWFDDILRHIAHKQKTTFLLSSRYRPRPEHMRTKPYVFALHIPELNYHERIGLFKRFTEFEGLALTRNDYAFFSGLFHGFPDQIKFACDMISDLGIQDTRKESHQLTEFNSNRAVIVLAKYADKPIVLDFLYLLSEFEFISLDFLFSIVSEDDYAIYLDRFIAESICEYVGIEKEFVRLNDVIRDYVRRNRLEIPDQFRHKLKEHLEKYIASDNTEERDVSDVIYSMKEGIKNGLVIPERYLIPSHFLKSIRELYEERGHLGRVIELADRVLTKEHLLDKTVAQNIRYYLCLSLARKKDNRMLKEVQKISGPEHNFLLGFYYRIQGRADDSIRCLKLCMNEPMGGVVVNRAKRELVQVYLSIEDYEAANVLARDNYEENRRNPYHIQAYFNTLVNSRSVHEYRDLLVNLISELESIGSDVSSQMAEIARAEFLAKCEGNYPSAFDVIDDAIRKYPATYYPLLTKAYLSARYHDLNRLKLAYDSLSKMAKEKTIPDDSLIRLRAYILVLEGNLKDALRYAENNLRRCPENARNAFLNRLQEISTQLNSEPNKEM